MVVTLAWGAAAQCSASTIGACRSQTCCGGSGGAPDAQCEWVAEQQCDPRTICNLNRKRLLANLTEMFGISDKQAERDILETSFPIPDSMAHLADLIAAERKRIINGYCECNQFSCCYQGCVPQSWSQWSACTVSCGSGTRSRSLAYYPPVCGAAPCDTNYETENCYPGACPVNCQVSTWSGWTCSAGCGPGTETRSRYIIAPEANGGSCPEAGSLSESRGCDAGCCPANCVLAAGRRGAALSAAVAASSHARAPSIRRRAAARAASRRRPRCSRATPAAARRTV
jgi:hypothetical protein